MEEYETKAGKARQKSRNQVPPTATESHFTCTGSPISLSLSHMFSTTIPIIDEKTSPKA